jgi:biopolymer transport protein ExbD
MGGVDVGGGGNGKRAVDQEINMVPFIDLLLVTISFLLITAVWSSMARLNANAQVPSNSKQKTDTEQKKQPSVLHVRVSDKDKKFKLEWQTGTKTDDVASIEIEEVNGRYPKLEEEIQKAFKAGQDPVHNLMGDDVRWNSAEAKEHGAEKLNQAIMHVDNAFPFKEVVKVIDAIYSARRYVCFEAAPACCGKPVGPGNNKSTEGGCQRGAEDVPAFNVAFSAN